MAGIMDRIQGLQRLMGDSDIALFYNNDISPSANFIYYAGANVGGVLAVPKNKKPFILTYSRDFESARASKLKTYSLDKGKKTFHVLKEILDENKIGYAKKAIDKENYLLLSYENMRKVLKGKFTDISKECRQQRSIKEPGETAKLKKACEITDEVFSLLLKKKGFRTEDEVSFFIEQEIRKRGAVLSFASIVASGKNGAMPHHDSKDMLRKGFLVLDYGAAYQGYHADMSRTVYLGKASKAEKEMYAKVLSVQETLVSGISPGKSCGATYDEANQLFGDLSLNFVHGLGHGVGLQIHEFPNITFGSSDVFLENMAFTIEPGLYFPEKYGIRIEDTLLLTSKGAERLTHSKKELMEIRS